MCDGMLACRSTVGWQAQSAQQRRQVSYDSLRRKVLPRPTKRSSRLQRPDVGLLHQPCRGPGDGSYFPRLGLHRLYRIPAPTGCPHAHAVSWRSNHEALPILESSTGPRPQALQRSSAPGCLAGGGFARTGRGGHEAASAGRAGRLGSPRWPARDALRGHMRAARLTARAWAVARRGAGCAVGQETVTVRPARRRHHRQSPGQSLPPPTPPPPQTPPQPLDLPMVTHRQ